MIGELGFKQEYPDLMHLILDLKHYIHGNFRFSFLDNK